MPYRTSVALCPFASGYSHVGDGMIPCSPEFREITFLLPVSFFLKKMPFQVLLLRPR